MSAAPRYLLSGYRAAEDTEFGAYPSREVMPRALAAEGSKACRGRVEVRPFRTAESVRTLLEP